MQNMRIYFSYWYMVNLIDLFWFNFSL